MQKYKEEKQIERLFEKILRWADSQNKAGIKNCSYVDDNVKIVFRHIFHIIQEYPTQSQQSERKYSRQMLAHHQNLGQQRHVNQFYQMLAKGKVSQINNGCSPSLKRKSKDKLKSNLLDLEPVES